VVGRVWSYAPPQRRGFGSGILYGLAKQFAEDVEATFLPRGLVYQLQVKLATIEG
jgi:hypothetical protein